MREGLINNQDEKIDTLISVIMLTYNRQQFVGRMTECILAQTFHDFEFIIVDNGSTDDSGKIADRYAAKDDRIHVIHREKGSIGAGRNTGLDKANGKYIAFVDDDDTCTPDFLQFLYDLIIENDADISICGLKTSDANFLKIMDSEEAVLTLLKRSFYSVGLPMKMFKRDLFENIKFLNGSRFDDIYITPKLLAEAKRVAYQGGSEKYTCNRHEGNNSAWTQHHELIDDSILREYLQVYDERTQWLCKRYPDKADEWRYFNWSFMISMVEKVKRLELHDCDDICEKSIHKLSDVRDRFVALKYTQDFEREWMEMYVG